MKQFDTPLLKELREHLANTSPEQLKKEWAEIKAMGLQGPTVEEFLNNNPITPHNMGGDIQKEMLDEICIGMLKFNRYRGSEELSIPAKLIHKVNQRELLALVNEQAESYGQRMHHQAKAIGMQLIGKLFLDAQVKSLPHIKSEILKACENDERAKKSSARRRQMQEFIKQLKTTI